MKKHSKKTFDRDIKYNRSAIFRSFLEHQLTGSSPESRSEVMFAFNRSIAKCLREPRTGRKPVTIKAVGNIDPKIIREAKHILNTTESCIYGYKTLAQLLLIAINPALQIMRVGSCERELAKMNETLAIDLRTMWKFVKSIYPSGFLYLDDHKNLSMPLYDMYFEVALCLVEHNTFEGGTYVLSYINDDLGKQSSGKPSFGKPTILIKKERRERTFKIDEKSRQAYGVGVLDYGSFSWSEIKGMPIYIQRHALDRLIERTAPIHTSKGNVWLTVCNSVSNPIIIERDGEFLLECNYCGHKVGYFICQIIEGAILITTFLFLTMSGTPEGEVLWKKLRIGRYDKEYLGLDNLRLFITSDLRSDMELVNLLKECKCDHLFDVEYKPDRVVAGVADDVMKYLSSNKYVMRLLNN